MQVRVETGVSAGGQLLSELAQRRKKQMQSTNEVSRALKVGCAMQFSVSSLAIFPGGDGDLLSDLGSRSLHD